MDAVNTFYGRGQIPIGITRSGKVRETSRYSSMAAQSDGPQLRYPHDLLNTSCARESIEVLRDTLAKARGTSVVIVQVGTSANLARLLRSPPDAISKYAGIQLVKRKVRLLSIMAGAFVPIDRQSYREFNVVEDITAAKHWSITGQLRSSLAASKLAETSNFRLRASSKIFPMCPTTRLPKPIYCIVHRRTIGLPGI